MKKIVISDIHGQLRMLLDVINAIDCSAIDEFIFLGDYVDRGPESSGVINYLINFSKDHNCVFLKGNHEDMMLRAFENEEDKYLWLLNGGTKTINSYDGAYPSKHVDWLNKLKLIHEDEKNIYVHAGIDPEKKLSEQKESDLLWIRDDFYMHPTGLKKTVVFGHTPILHLNKIDSVKADKIACDYGAAYPRHGGFLKAVEV